MPTGYTAKLHNGEEQTFREFVLSCAKAFGAMVTLRDTPDAEIPEAFEVSDRFYKNLSEAQKELDDFLRAPDSELTFQRSEEMVEKQQRYEEALKKDEELYQRYSSMLEKVSRWAPPEELRSLKDFMARQLYSSMDGDVGLAEYIKPTTQSYEGWKTSKIEELSRGVEFAAKVLVDEQANIKGKNEWLSKLWTSLPDD